MQLSAGRFRIVVLVVCLATLCAHHCGAGQGKVSVQQAVFDLKGYSINPKHPVKWQGHGVTLSFTDITKFDKRSSGMLELRVESAWTGPAMTLDYPSALSRDHSGHDLECFPCSRSVHLWATSHGIQGVSSSEIRIGPLPKGIRQVPEISGILTDGQDYTGMFGPFPASGIKGSRECLGNGKVSVRLYDLVIDRLPATYAYTCVDPTGKGMYHERPDPGPGKYFVSLRFYDIESRRWFERRPVTMHAILFGTKGEKLTMSDQGYEADNRDCSHPYIGVQTCDLSAKLKKMSGATSGVWVVGVDPTSPAHKSGILAGDAITRIGAVTLKHAAGPCDSTSPTDMFAVMDRVHAGQPVSVTLMRHGKRLSKTLVPGVNPLWTGMVEGRQAAWDSLKGSAVPGEKYVGKIRRLCTDKPVPSSFVPSKVQIEYSATTLPCRIVKFKLLNVGVRSSAAR